MWLDAGFWGSPTELHWGYSWAKLTCLAWYCTAQMALCSRLQQFLFSFFGLKTRSLSLPFLGPFIRSACSAQELLICIDLHWQKVSGWSWKNELYQPWPVTFCKNLSISFSSLPVIPLRQVLQSFCILVVFSSTFLPLVGLGTTLGFLKCSVMFRDGHKLAD